MAMILNLIKTSTIAITMITAATMNIIVSGKPGGAGSTVIFVWPCPSMYPFFVAVAVMVTLRCVAV
jgi:hypothetical protein